MKSNGVLNRVLLIGLVAALAAQGRAMNPALSDGTLHARTEELLAREGVANSSATHEMCRACIVAEDELITALNEHESSEETVLAAQLERLLERLELGGTSPTP